MSEIDHDPFFDWIYRNPEAAKLHAGKRFAFDPQIGLLAIGDSFEDVLNTLTENERAREGLYFGRFPSEDAVWIDWIIPSQERDP